MSEHRASAPRLLPPWERPSLEECLTDGIWKQIALSEYPPARVEALLAQALVNGMRFHVRHEWTIRSVESCVKTNG